MREAMDSSCIIHEAEAEREMVAPPGLEPGSEDPESPMLDHYTTGLPQTPDN